MTESARPIEQVYYDWGRLRSEPPELQKGIPHEYELGFRDGIAQDFETFVLYNEIPQSSHAYESFLAGLAAAEYRGPDSEIAWSRKTNIYNSYILGLKLMLLSLGEPVELIQEKAEEAVGDSILLGHYQTKLEKLLLETR